MCPAALIVLILPPVNGKGSYMPQKIHETLPANSVDLDTCCVQTMASAIEDTALVGTSAVDAVILSGNIGVFNNATGETTWVDWGKTAPDAHGIYIVVVDIEKITLPVLQVLWAVNVIEGEQPTPAK